MAQASDALRFDDVWLDPPATSRACPSGIVSGHYRERFET